MSTREHITRILAALLAVFMLFGASNFALSYWAGKEDWHALVEALVRVVIVWAFAAHAFEFPGPHTFLFGASKATTASKSLMRAVVVLLTVAMFADIALTAYSFWTGGKNGLLLQEVLFGLLIAWILAGQIGFPGPRAYLAVVGTTAFLSAVLTGYFDGPWYALPMLLVAAYAFTKWASAPRFPAK